MKTVNSLSGGKSSSYMALHYPADYNVFALVRIDDVKCKPKDVSLIQKVSDKIGKEFIATAEDDLTLYAMFDLEQLLGKEIIWLSGDSFDQVIKSRNAIPNMFKRFCTTEMKMKVMFEWWFMNIGERIIMNIGFRSDESHRQKHLTSTFKYHVANKTFNTRRRIWEIFDWRQTQCPMIIDGVHIYKVREYINSTNLKFPNSSNCKVCFWKSEEELAYNWTTDNDKMQWGADKEIQMKRTFKNGITYEQLKKINSTIPIFETGDYCMSGGCTD